MKKHSLIRIAGLVWLVVGTGLISMGFRFFSVVLHDPSLVHIKKGFSFLRLMTSYPYQTVVMWLMISAFLIGYLKGRTVLKKSALRQIQRIEAITTQAKIYHLYSPGFFILVLFMIGLGISMRFLPITLEVRAFIDVAIGTALLQGALHYFRYTPAKNMAA